MNITKRLLVRPTWGSTERLSPRVRVAIRDQQRASEVLIGWVQLGIVVLFGLLYVMAPKTFPDEARFMPVPWVLTAYLVFATLRVALGRERRLPEWVIYIWVVMNMALLYVLIWSFHIQYMQPAAFYLKAPTLLYVFIFIALQALRFQVRYVLAAGISAAVGWLVLVAYAVDLSPSSPVITRDYVDYMTSNHVLIGAELDKVISILIVTAILSLAIARAREILARSMSDRHTAQNLSRFVPEQVARQVAGGKRAVRAGGGEMREATVLFTDITGFTTISETLSPEALINILNEYFSVVAEPIERYGGVINQFQGDAILATFNVPTENPDHAANAVRAAIAVQRALENRSFGDGVALATRIGINSGMLVGGLVGTSERLGFTVHGDHVNLAARLVQLNQKLGTSIVCSAHTRELAGPERFPFIDKGTEKVRGRQAPVQIFGVSV